MSGAGQRDGSRVGARRALVVALLATLLAGSGWWAGLWEHWEARSWDVRASLLAQPGVASEDIILVLLDQPSLDWAQQENGLGWPWPRELYGVLTDFVARGQPRAWILDVLYLEPSVYGVSDDERFAAALTDQPAVLAFFASPGQSGTRSAWPETLPVPAMEVAGPAPGGTVQSQGVSVQALYRKLPLALGPGEGWDEGNNSTGGSERLSQVAGLSLPVLPLAEAVTALGNAHATPDPDGIYRRMRPVTLLDALALPSLAVAAYSVGEAPLDAPPLVRDNQLRLGAQSFPLDATGQAILRYRGPVDTYTSFSAAALLQAELRLRQGEPAGLDPAIFNNKYVLFGFSAPGLLDLRPTPVDGVFPGVAVHATLLDNLLSGDLMRPVAPLLTLTLMGLLAAAAAWSLTGRVTASSSAFWGSLWLVSPFVLVFSAYWYGYWLHWMGLQVAVVLAVLSSWLLNYAVEGRQRRFIRSAFQHYLSTEVIEQILREPERLRLGGERKTMTFFFTDLEGFTALSEVLSPEQLTDLLNDYLSAMTDIVQEEGGTLDKFQGDAIMAFWNAPVPVADHARRAVRAAVRCQQRLAELSPQYATRYGRPLFMRIGIHTGVAVVGNMGSHDRFDYTVLGDAVNLAARLEGVNKRYRSGILVSDATRAALVAQAVAVAAEVAQAGQADKTDEAEGVAEAAGVGVAEVAEVAQAGDPDLPLREVGCVAVVGREQPVTLYQPVPTGLSPAQLTHFAAALQQFYQGRFGAALAGFLALADADPVAAAYLRISHGFYRKPPPHWHGVWVLDGK